MLTLDDVRAKHPVGARRGFTVPCFGLKRYHGAGDVVGHVIGLKGPFIESRDADGKVRRVRPGYCRKPVEPVALADPIAAAAAG